MADSELRTFSAPTMAEALTKVKRELGKDAVIVHTRSFRVGGVLGVGGRTMVEIAASAGAEPAFTPATSRRARASVRLENSEPPRAATTNGEARNEPARAPDRAPDPARELREALGAIAGSEIEAKPRPEASRTTSATARSIQSETIPGLLAESRKPTPRDETPTPSPEAAPIPPRPRIPDVPAIRSHRPKATEDPGVPALRTEIDQLRALVGEVLDATRRNSVGGSDPISRWIEDAGFDASTANALKNAVREDADDPVGAVRRTLASRLETDRLDPRDLVGDGRPGIVALVGPTGVGKTTTLAKLAAEWKLRRGLRVGLVATDTYRIAAVDQLRSYAGIIGLPLKVASSPAEIAPAVEGLEGCEIVLVDTAGRSQNDTDRLGRIRETLHAASPDRTLLCVSLAAGEKTIDRTVERFRTLGPDGLVLTKLDESESPGVATRAMAGAGLPVTHLTFGQEVPDDIEDATPDRLSDAIVHDLPTGDQNDQPLTPEVSLRHGAPLA